MLQALEERARQLEKEREAQHALAAKIQSMQSKLLSGDGNLLDQTREQQRLLQQKRIELTEQKVIPTLHSLVSFNQHYELNSPSAFLDTQPRLCKYISEGGGTSGPRP